MMSRSSRYGRHQIPASARTFTTWAISLVKMRGATFNPNGMALNCQNSFLQRKHRKDLFRRLTGTCQKPSLRSKDVVQKFFGNNNFISLNVSILKLGHFMKEFRIDRSRIGLASCESLFGTVKILLWKRTIFALSITLFLRNLTRVLSAS